MNISSLFQRSRLKGTVPVFPIGCPRSGTTLLARVLNAHPRILMTNETAVFLQLHESITKSRTGFAEGLMYGKEHNALWADYLSERAKSLIEGYYEEICAVEGKGSLRYWGEKHPHHFEILDFISTMYPGAKYVYIVRDPRDVLCSISQLNHVDPVQAIEGLKYAVDRYEAFVKNLPKSSLLYIRYEDFTANYEATGLNLFAWLGLEYAPEVRRFLREYSHVDVHAEPGRGKEVELVDFSTRSVGRWRRELPDEAKLRAQERFRDYLERYRYETSRQSSLPLAGSLECS